jgi:predicted Holliday junction resolvase-like endonuclease
MKKIEAWARRPAALRTDAISTSVALWMGQTTKDKIPVFDWYIINNSGIIISPGIITILLYLVILLVL